MQFFKQATKFDFMGKRKLAIVFSVLLIVLSIGALITRGLNFGLDFTGGTLIEVGYTKPVDLEQVRGALDKAGFEDAIVQHFGTAKDVLVRLAPKDNQSANNIGDAVLKTLNQASDEPVQMRRQEYVGPQVGDELRDDGGLAMIIALAFIMIYVMSRFEYRFALGAITALIHDVIITLGCFAAFQWDFDLTVLAAVLAVIGYSLNDTIVVFDRIRENFRRMRKETSVEVVNYSLNQTLSRTIMTSITTLFVVVAMFIWGGELIHSFALALIVGILVGTYSSIYVASTTILAMNITSASLIPVEKEGVEQDDMVGPGE
ncbi:MAG: protein translocase subunit SecF [Gammaproteobacteria bacterium]|nr:protein translocase subunit SecF [Gammaproteobacteria bacterium]